MFKRSKYIIFTALAIISSLFLSSCYDALSEKLAEFAPEAELSPAEEDSESVETAPDFTVYDNDGNEVSLSDKFGKPIIVNFWATWCGPCKKELPIFNSAYLEHGDDIEFMMVDLTNGYNDTPERVKEFVQDGGYSFPLYHDVSNDAAKTYGITNVPFTIFINPDGTLRYYQLGALNEEIMEFALSELLELVEK